MKKSSIFLWITIIFLLAFLGIAASYMLSLKYIKAHSQNQLQKRFDFISQSIIWQLANPNNIKTLLDELQKVELVAITNTKEVVKIAKRSKIIKRTKFPIGEVIILKYQNNYYIWVQSLGNVLLLKDISQNILYTKGLATTIFLLVTLLLLLVYILILIKLRPLKKIANEIEKFSKGDLDIHLDIQSSKEINEVANALKNAAISLKNIQNSRKLLLRNIMHELKTPITKGRITAELLQEEKQKNRLISIFDRLNSLINDIAALEAMDSGIKPEFKEIKVSELIEEAINLGMFDKSYIQLKIHSEPLLKVDYKLCSIAIKNLIDNALKHSPHGCVRVVTTKKELLFINKGEALQKDLEFYTQAFVKGSKSKGFGLGLYIVSSICKIHQFHFSYRYKMGYSIFSIRYNNSF